MRLKLCVNCEAGIALAVVALACFGSVCNSQGPEGVAAALLQIVAVNAVPVPAEHVG